MKRNSIQKQSGRSMVEMLGVLAIIGVLSVGAIAGYNMAIEKHRINNALEAMQLIIHEVTTLYKNQENYEGLGRAQSKYLHYANAGPAKSILEKVAGDVSYNIQLRNDGSDSFQVIIYGLSANACVSIASQKWNQYGDNDGGIAFNSDEDQAILTMSDVINNCGSLVALTFSKNGGVSIEFML